MPAFPERACQSLAIRSAISTPRARAAFGNVDEGNDFDTASTDAT